MLELELVLTLTLAVIVGLLMGALVLVTIAALMLQGLLETEPLPAKKAQAPKEATKTPKPDRPKSMI